MPKIHVCNYHKLGDESKRMKKAETASKTFPLMAQEQVASEVQEEDHSQLVQNL